MLVVTKPKLGDSPMTTLDFITQLFCRVDDKMTSVSKHSQANLYPNCTDDACFAVHFTGSNWLMA